MPELIASPFADSPWLQALLWAKRYCALLLRVGAADLFRDPFCTAGSTGVLAVPGAWWVGNFINFMAVSRAWKMFPPRTS